MFSIHTKERSPSVISPRIKGNRVEWNTTQIDGTLYRVTPTTAREVMALRMLTHREQKYAPAHGNGALISEFAFAQLTAR